MSQMSHKPATPTSCQARPRQRAVVSNASCCIPSSQSGCLVSPRAPNSSARRHCTFGCPQSPSPSYTSRPATPTGCPSYLPRRARPCSTSVHNQTAPKRGAQLTENPQSTSTAHRSTMKRAAASWRSPPSSARCSCATLRIATSSHSPVPRSSLQHTTGYAHLHSSRRSPARIALARTPIHQHRISSALSLCIYVAALSTLIRSFMAQRQPVPATVHL